MKRYICTVCNFVYDEPAEMPDDYECPMCSVGKSEFTEMEE